MFQFMNKWDILQSTSYGFVSKCARGAIPYKKCCGKAAYEIAAVELLIGKKPDTYEIIADGKTIFPSLKTLFVMIFNGRRAGGGMHLTPTNLINDGFLDYTILTKDFGRLKLIDLLDKSKK